MTREPRIAAPPPSDATGSSRVRYSIWCALLALLVAFAPGEWSFDSRYYIETLTGTVEATGASNRDYRLIAKALFAAGRGLFGGAPQGASLFAALALILAAEATWRVVAARLDTTAAWVASVVLVAAPVTVRESVQPSADLLLTAFGAGALLLCDRVRSERPPPAWLLGATLGIGFVTKELFVIVVLPVGAWTLFELVRRRVRLGWFVCVWAVAAGCLLLDAWATSNAFPAGGRMALVSAKTGRAAGAHAMTDLRVWTGVIPALLTDVRSLGALGLASAVACVGAVTLRRWTDPAVWIGAGGLLLVGWLPTSFSPWTLLPAWHAPRYLLAVWPALVVVLMHAVSGGGGRLRVLPVAVAGLVALRFLPREPLLMGGGALVVAAALLPEVHAKRIGPLLAGAGLLLGFIALSVPWFVSVGLVAAAAVGMGLAIRGGRRAGAGAVVVLAALGLAVAIGWWVDLGAARATWRLRERIGSAERVFATVEIQQFLRIQAGPGEHAWSRHLDKRDVAAGRLPATMQPGDVLVRRADPEDPVLAARRADERVVLEHWEGYRILRLSRTP